MCFHIYPFRNLSQRLFYAFYFWSSNISNRRGCMSIKRGQRDVVKVNESDFGNTSAGKKPMSVVVERRLGNMLTIEPT